MNPGQTMLSFAFIVSLLSALESTPIVSIFSPIIPISPL